jgi:hypothetical protein
MRVYFDRRGRGSSMSPLTALVLIVLLIAAAIAFWQITVVIVFFWLLAIWARSRGRRRA